MKRKTRTFLIIFTLLIVDFSLSFASKLDKKHDKHKSPASPHESKKDQQTAHKNSTSPHNHSNHSAPVTPAPIGWSLDKDQAQQHHNNPNGMILHHHEQHSSGGGQHQQAHSPHQMGNTQQPGSVNQPGNYQQQPNNVQHQGDAQHLQPQAIQPTQPQQSSGIGSAVAAGVGGLALGAGGGYLLSNLMNSDKSGEKVEKVEDTTVAATTTTESTITSTTTIEASTTVEASTSGSPVIAETSTLSESSSVDSNAADVTTTTTILSETTTTNEATTESLIKDIPTDIPVVLAAGLVPGIQAAKVNENSDTTQAVTEINSPTATGKSNANFTHASLKLAIFILAIQFLLIK